MEIQTGQDSKPGMGSNGGRTSRRLLRVGLAFFVAFCAAATTCAQSRYGPGGPQNSQAGDTSNVTPRGAFQGRRIRELNVERQREMVTDTNKLLELTGELNAEIAKNHGTELTADQLHMLERIEKLAKSVKEKMTNPVQGTIFEESFPPPMSMPGMQ